ncbi:MAG: TetR/AcrR family transcriptional regulator [Cohaesibacteraceae bacterium]|mgnify:CR=1 FL=1
MTGPCFPSLQRRALPPGVLDALETSDCREPAGRKEAVLLDAAQQVFLEHGYSGASVDDIVVKAGISKATLYKYFCEKEALFSAVIQRVCREQQALFNALTFNESTEDALIEGSKMAIDFMTSPLAVDIFRMCVAETKRFPQVGHIFYVSASFVMEQHLITLFERAEEAGDLVIRDKLLASNQFWQLCRTDYFYAMLLNLRDSISREERDSLVRSTLEMFVGHYGTEPFKSRLAERLKDLPQVMTSSDAHQPSDDASQGADR